jgi:NADH-quinone oxidoreductase subunit G
MLHRGQAPDDDRRRRGAEGGRIAPRSKLVEQFGLVKDGWNGFNVVHMAASRMGGLMLGYAQKGGIADLPRPSPGPASSAPTRSISPASPAASRSISAITATRARMRPI